MSNIKEAILSMKSDVDSIYEVTKILIRESENAKDIDDLDILSSFITKRLLPIMLNWDRNNERKKLSELSNRLKEILNYKGIAGLTGIAELTMIMGELSDKIRKGLNSLSADEELILILRSLGRNLHGSFDFLSKDEQMVVIVKSLGYAINKDFDSLSSDEQNILIAKSLSEKLNIDTNKVAI